jgi:hypothetical protein
MTNKDFPITFNKNLTAAEHVANFLDQAVPQKKTVDINGEKAEMKWSGLIIDGQGEAMQTAKSICAKHGREGDLIVLAPGGKWRWNPIYCPWSNYFWTSHVFSKMINQPNEGSMDPFWKFAAREVISDAFYLLAYGQSYYNIKDYMRALEDWQYQDKLLEAAQEKHKSSSFISDIEALEARHKKRRDEFSGSLMQSLIGCAKVGLGCFSVPEIADVFSPPVEKYFNDPAAGDSGGVYSDLFFGFGHLLDAGKIVVLYLPYGKYFDSCRVIRDLLLFRWMDAVYQRNIVKPDGEIERLPDFGADNGYCPTFFLTDEFIPSAHDSMEPFFAQLVSKKALCYYASPARVYGLEGFGTYGA